MLADDNLLRLILAKVDQSPAGFAPLAWLSCANVCRQWRRLMFELPLAWRYEPEALAGYPIEHVKATKLRFKTIVEVDYEREEYISPPLLELLANARFQRRQGAR